MTTFNCLNCGTERPEAKNTANKYCNNKCQGEYRFRNETLPRYRAGEVSDRDTLRKILIEERGDECSVCGIDEWNGMPITFQVDHMNGLANDNSPENLRLICANCHSQTPHYGGRNKGNGRAALGIALK